MVTNGSVCPAVVIDRVSFAYDREPALADVSLTIAARDFVSFVGPNGGGKTTLVRLILGLLQPTRGTIRVFGTTPVAARKRMGYVPQSSQYDPHFPVTVLDVVLLGRIGIAAGVGPFRAADRAAALAALGEVGLADCARRPFSALSGGQRQRVLIARALACGPDLLLLDEPTSNLDQAVEAEFYELLRRLNARMAIAIVSHDLGVVSRVVNTVVCVSRTVEVHASSALTGETIAALYGHGVRMVRHDHGHEPHSHPDAHGAHDAAQHH